MKIPDGLERWRADAHEQDRKRRTATRHRHEQERADIMARAQAAATPSDIDQRIAAAVEAERERNYAVMQAAFRELLAMIDKRIDAALAVADKAASQIEKVGSEVRRLTADKPDGNGIVRRQCFTPGPLDLN